MLDFLVSVFHYLIIHPLIILGSALSFPSVVILKRTIKENRKIKDIKALTNKVHNNISNDSDMKDSMIIGLGTISLSMVDLCMSFVIHSDTLETLSYRFPHAVGDNGIIDWINKVGELHENSDLLATYISAYKGQAAEDLAIKMLSSKGIHAELFESLTHKADDIHTSVFPGMPGTDYSVKCGSVRYITDCIEHTTSDHYIINTESYEYMRSHGLIDHYHQQGIEILDGHYSNEELQHAASDTFSDIHESTDITHSIPWISIGFFAYKTGKNYKQKRNGKQSTKEFTTNVIIDAAGIGVRAVAGKLAGSVGGTIGTVVCPGVGTIIGSTLGMFAGVFVANKELSSYNKSIKWGSIIDAQDSFGSNADSYLSVLGNNAADSFLNESALIKDYKDLSESLNNFYSEELNPKSPKKVSIDAVLSRECEKKFSIMIKGIDYMKNHLDQALDRFCLQLTSSIKNKKKRTDAIRRLKGELLLRNSSLLGNLSDFDRDTVEQYEKSRKICPNYPIQYSSDPSEVFEAIVYKAYEEGIELAEKASANSIEPSTVKLVFSVFTISVSMLLIILGVVL